MDSKQIYYGYWLILAAFIAQFVAVGTQNYVIGPFFTPMTEDLGWTRAEFTFSRTLGQVIMAITGFFIGSHIDRLGAKKFMLTGCLVLSLSLFLTSYVSRLWHWILLNGVMLTLGASLVGNLVVNVTLAKWFVSFRGRAIALAAMGVSFAGVLLTPLITSAIDNYGWRQSWQFLSVGTLLLVIPVALSMRRAPEDYGLHPDGHTPSSKNREKIANAADDFANSLTRRQALRTVSFYLLVLSFGLFIVTIQVMLLQTIPFMTDAGYSRMTAASMIVLASVPALISKPIWGWLIDGLDAKPLASASAAITGISLVMIVFGANHQSIVWIYTGFFLMGVGWGGMIPLQEVIWASFYGRRYLGAVRSAAMPLSLIFLAGAPLATSYYYDLTGSYDGAILVVAASNLFSALLMLFIPKPPGNPHRIID